MAGRPPQGWRRFAVREVFLGLLGFPGDGRVPERGWLRYATIGFYIALVLVAALLIVALLFG